MSDTGGLYGFCRSCGILVYDHRKRDPCPACGFDEEPVYNKVGYW